VSIEVKAKAEAKRLMAEVSQLQAKAKTENAASKTKTHQLIKEINQIQLAMVKNPTPNQGQLVKQKTKQLFEDQLANLAVRQTNIREQINRLLQAQKKYELIYKNNNTKMQATDKRFQQQLMNLIKSKKEEYLQLERDTVEIHQRARQKKIVLSERKVTSTNRVSPSARTITNSQRTQTEPLEDILNDTPSTVNLAERAKSEAEKLIVAVSQNENSHNPATDRAANKTQEVGKMIEEINRLQSSAEQGTLSASEIEELENRVKNIEGKQRQTREQINQLTQAKIKYELAVNRSAEIRTQAQQQRVQDEKLQQELNQLIGQKEDEQQQLLDELKQIRNHSEQEAALLKAQRDAARALAEQKQNDVDTIGLGNHNKNSVLGLLVVSLSLLLLLGGGGIYYFLFYLDNLDEKTAKVAQKQTRIDRNNSHKQKNTDKANKAQQASNKAAAKKATALYENGVEPLRMFQDRLKSGGKAPMMVQLPGGHFLMGSKPHLPYANERPQVRIQLQGFSIGRYEVTQGEYRRFATRRNRRIPDNEGWLDDQQPVINISYEDAEAYTKWLTKQTGHRYRVPSEREWAYAAIAGSKTIFWWGKRVGKNHANCGVCGSQWDNLKPAPVGSFQPNNFGLFDTVGNVLEWTRSCYHPNYKNAPPTGKIWEVDGDCSYRMVRSSAYSSYKRDIRTAKRTRLQPNARTNNLGFRIMRVN